MRNSVFLFIIYPVIAISFVYGQTSKDRYMSVPIGTKSPNSFENDFSNMGYMEYYLEGYDKYSGESYPLLVYLHGLGERGDGTSGALDSAFFIRNIPERPIISIPALIRNNKWPVTGDDDVTTPVDFVVLIPQYSDTIATPDEIHDFINFAIGDYPIDPKRIYITGISSGAISIYRYLVQYQDQVAAAAPVAGTGEPVIESACNIKIPVWGFHNLGDYVIPVDTGYSIIPEINNCSPPPIESAKFTVFQKTDHNAWKYSYKLLYNTGTVPEYDLFDMNLYEWFMQYTKPDPDPDPGDLIVDSNLTIDSDTEVANVNIQPAGNLTIGSNVTLSVSGDFNIDGILNGQAGTINFNDVDDSAPQIISGSSANVDFYNLTVSNGGTFGVRSEVDINLHNTLSLADGAIFDTDGSSNDKNFTLVSTASSTARIAQMGIDAQLNGEIIWQRSLRTGPAGFRYIGTPIKGQTLADISDDVWIQGIDEHYPGGWTNISTYNESSGTNNAGGPVGWENLTSNSQILTAGTGMKLFLWEVHYAPEQMIEMKGEPIIGDGVNGIAGSDEVIRLNTSYTATAYDGGGWNFFANPYPSEIDWHSVTKDANINGEALHVWNPNTQSYGSYSPLSGGISINGITRYVASGQGFFVKAEAEESFVEFSESCKSTADGNSFLRVGDENLFKIKIEISSGDGIAEETAVVFTNLASDDFDSQFDVRKLAGGNINLSSVIHDKQIAINAMGEKRGVQSVKLNIVPLVFGNFIMKFPLIESSSERATIRLVDKYLNRSQYISSASSYSFNIIENDPDTYGADRFELQFIEPARFRFGKLNAKAGQEFVMPVLADKLEDIINTNMALSWDSEALTFIGLEDTGSGDLANFDLTMVEKGKLKYYDEQIDPLHLPDGTQLFSIRFLAKNGIPQAQLKFDQAMMSLKAISDIDLPFSSEDVLIDVIQHRFVHGTVATYSGETVNDVKLTAQNQVETIENISKVDGSYTLNTYEQSEYKIDAIKSDDSQIMDVVTTLDIIQTRRHILNKEAFTSPYQWIAADVNRSNTITAIDLVEMMKVILGINPTFQSGLNWLFIPDSNDLTNDPFSYQTSLNITLKDQDIDLDFIGVKVGDVDNSWANSDGSRRSKRNFSLSMESLILDDDQITIPVIVNDFNNILGYQFTLTWDPGELQYYSASSMVEGFFNEQLTDRGILTTLWDETNGEAIELKKGDTLMTLQFKALNEDAVSKVSINSAVTPAIAIDGNLNTMSINSTTALVDLHELSNGSMKLLQNVPNPFEFNTEIGFNLPSAGQVRFSIVNTFGEKIYLHQDYYNAGIYNIKWDRSQGLRTISPGVYLYMLESNGERILKKMVIK